MAMPLADATAIQFTSPMITGMLSPLLLGEKAPKAVWARPLWPSPACWWCCGPTSSRSARRAFYPLGAAAGMACLMICNRKAAGRGLADRDAIPASR